MALSSSTRRATQSHATTAPQPWRRCLIRRLDAVPQILLAAALASSVGCYHYSEVPVNELAPGMAVRMELSAVAVDRFRKGADSLAALIDGFKVSGAVSHVATDTVLLAVTTNFMEANVRARTQTHDLPLLRSDVYRAQIRRLDTKRTTWLVAALGAVTAASVFIVLNHGGKSSGGKTPPIDPVDTRLPFLLRLPIP